MVRMAANDFNKMFVATLEPLYTQANDLATKIQAASGDQKTIIADIRDDANSTDDKVKEFQAYIAKMDEARENAFTKIAEHITKNLLPAKDDSFNVDEAKEQHKALRGQINAGRTYAKGMGISDEDLSAALPELKNLRGGSGGSSSATGEGPKRPRVSKIVVNGEEVSAPKKVKADDGTETTVDVVSFTVLGTYLTKAAGTKVEPGLIRDEVFKAANTEDLSDVKGQTFNVTQTINGKDFKIDVTV